MLTKKLEDIGLSEKEAKVYVATLELGEGSASEIAKKSGINRATTYFALENLMKIGLVSASNEEKKQKFIPEDPTQLENIIEKQQQELEQKKKGLKDIVEKLNNINSASIKKPIVKYYLGKEGIMRMAKSSFDFTKDETMWLAFSLDELKNFLIEDEINELKKQRKEHGTKLQSMYNSQDEIQKSKPNNLRILINKEKFPFPGDVAIYGDSIRLTSYKEQIGIVVQNKDIATTLKSIFKLALKSS